jgi:hypothetical protein
MMEQHIKEENITYYDYNEFINIKELGVEVYKANWKQNGKLVALKSLSLNDERVKEIVREVCSWF